MQVTLSVSALNNYLKTVVDNDIVLQQVVVQGEISNFKTYAYGGQWYFTLKDAESQVQCVMFETYTRKMKYIPKDGEMIVLKGKVGVFHKRGTYSVQGFWLEPVGVGQLAKAFELLKDTLAREGLFATEQKRPLPRFPQHIALLAASEGAARHDFISIAKRRWPGVKITFFSTTVQGGNAIASIVHNLMHVNTAFDCDVIVLARGGGSLEDLWSFNEEVVARAIRASRVPVVSAIGHEVDYTIADFVADLRAPTPSAAAELVVPDIRQWHEWVVQTKETLMKGLQHVVVDMYEQVDFLQERMQEELQRKTQYARDRVFTAAQNLELLSPLAVLSRGYAVVRRETQIITRAVDLQPHDIIEISFQQGTCKAKIYNEI